MKKYLLLLGFVFVLSLVKAGVPLYVSSSPNGYPATTNTIGNDNILTVTFSEAIVPNMDQYIYSTLDFKLGTSTKLTVYSLYGAFYTDIACTAPCSYVYINPSNTTQLLIDLKSFPIYAFIKQSYTFNFAAGFVVSSLVNTGKSPLFTLKYRGALPVLYESKPYDLQPDFLPTDVVILTFSSGVELSMEPSLLFQILNVADNSVFWFAQADNEVNFDNSIGNVVKLQGIPAFVVGNSYKIVYDEGFFSDPTYTKFVPALLDGDLTFTVNKLEAVGFIPLNGGSAGVNEAFTITYPEAVSINTGNIYIKRGSSVIETIPVANCSLDNTKTILSIPHYVLEPNISYHILLDGGIVKSVSSGAKSVGVSSSTEWNFTTNSANKYKGLSPVFLDNTNWNTSFNPTIPTIIPGGVTNPAVVTTSLTTSADFIVTPTGSLRVDGTLSVSPGNIIKLESSATSNSSLIVNGTLNATAHVYQYAGNSSPTSQYKKGYATPVSSTTGSACGFTNVIKRYNNVAKSYETVDPAESLVPGVGYASYATSDLVFKGSVNTGDYMLPLLYTAVPTLPATGTSAYNYYGNPYTAAIDWKLMYADTLVSGNNLARPSCWILKQSNTWIVINGNSGQVTGDGTTPDPVIPRGHAFMVRAKVGLTGGVMSIKKSYLQLHNSTYLKSGSLKSTSTEQAIALRFTAISGTEKEDILYSFHPNALRGFDVYDSEKYTFPDATVTNRLQLATYSDTYSGALAINNDGALVTERSFYIAYYSKTGGVYQLELTDAEGVLNDPNTVIVLTDTQNNISRQIKKGDIYTFATVATTAVNKTRFRVDLNINSLPTGIEEGEVKKVSATDVAVNYSLSSINVTLSNNNLQLIEVYNINGTKLLSREVSGNSAVVPFEGSGVYVVKVISDKGVSSHKIVASAVR